MVGRVHGTIYSLGGYLSGSGSSDSPEGNRSLVINEIAASGDPLDWFELYNPSDEPMDLSGFVVADDLHNESKRVPFPDGARIGPGDHVRFELDKQAWPGFALGQDEELGIWDVDGALVDSVDWAHGQAAEGTSYARVPDGTGDFETVNTPTPEAPNGASR